MANILSIETGTDVCSVGLSVEGELVSLRESSEGRNHAKNIAVFIDDIFNESILTVSSLDAVAVGLGPGSYTGLRIGVSLAKGICFANNIPLIAVNSLEALTKCAIEDIEGDVLDHEIDEDTLFVPMIDARRMEVYTQLFDAKCNALSQVEAKIIDENSYNELQGKELVLFGNGAKKSFDVISYPNKVILDVVPSVRGMVSLAYQKYLNKDFVDLAYFEPLYLKDFIGTKSVKNYLK